MGLILLYILVVALCFAFDDPTNYLLKFDVWRARSKSK